MKCKHFIWFFFPLSHSISSDFSCFFLFFSLYCLTLWWKFNENFFWWFIFAVRTRKRKEFFMENPAADKKIYSRHKYVSVWRRLYFYECCEDTLELMWVTSTNIFLLFHIIFLLFLPPQWTLKVAHFFFRVCKKKMNEGKEREKERKKILT